jgi:hypothetical protein
MKYAQSILNKADFFLKLANKNATAANRSLDLDIEEEYLPKATAIFNSIIQKTPDMTQYHNNLSYILDNIDKEIQNQQINKKFFADSLLAAKAVVQTIVSNLTNPSIKQEVNAYLTQLNSLIKEVSSLVPSNFVIGAPINKQLQQNINKLVALKDIDAPLLNINGVIDKNTKIALEAVANYFNILNPSLTLLESAIQQELNK